MPEANTSTENIADTLEFRHSAVIVSINTKASQTDIYTAARYAWRIDPKRASKHRLVMAVVKGVVVGVFDNVRWVPATVYNFPGFEPKLPERWGFTASPAADEIAAPYIGKRLPASMTKKGASNPVKYAGVEEGFSSQVNR